MSWHNIIEKFNLLKSCTEENAQLKEENAILRIAQEERDLLREEKKLWLEECNLLQEKIHLLNEENGLFKEISMTDELTGLFARRYLQNVAPLFSTQERNEKFLAVIFIDLDNFKTANDTCGHDAGDEILVRVAAIFQEAIRESDIAIRLGGDEFLIIATNVADKDGLLTLSDRLHKSVAEMQVEDCDVKITLSVGICFVGKNDNGKMIFNLNEAMELADKAMYQSKKNSRNQTTLVEGWEDLSES